MAKAKKQVLLSPQINPMIIERLKEYLIEDTDSAILYLLGIFYGLNVEKNIDDEVIKQVNITKIVERDYANTESVGHIWNVPLFVGSNDLIPEAEWEWIDDYRKKFSAVVPAARGDKATCYDKMKKFFAAHPSVRVDEIMAAVDLYIMPFASGANNPKYLTQADNFIWKFEKGDGQQTKKSKLEQFLEIVKEKSQEGEGNRFTRNVRGDNEWS